MTTPRFAKLATDLLAEEEDTRASSSDVEMRALAAIEHALARRRRSRRIAQVAGATALAVAATLLVVFAGWATPREKEAAAPVPAPSAAPVVVAAKAVEPGEGTMLARDGRTESLVQSMSLTAGDRIDTSPKDGSEIALADGSRIRVGSASEVSFNDLSTTRRFLLTRGTLRADVAKLGPSQRFIVDTEDAEVEVHGTSFVVTVGEASDGCPARTRVEVTEGIVSVRSGGREDRVPAGSTWPVCEVREVRAAHDAGTRAAPMPPSAPATAALAPVPPAPSAAASHALAAQNALFAKANAARRAGDGPAAVAAYDRLLNEYPDGFLAESAAVERMRVLDGMEHARGRQAASAYLARYPNGFARAEAQRIAQ